MLFKVFVYLEMHKNKLTDKTAIWFMLKNFKYVQTFEDNKESLHNTQDHRLLIHPYDPLQSTKTDNMVSVTVAAVSVVNETLLN